MTSSAEFLIQHLGCYVAPECADIASILGAGHPIFGLRGFDPSGRVQIDGIKGHSGRPFLVTASGVTYDAYLGKFYTSPAAAEKKMKAKPGKDDVLIVQDHLPALLRERGVTHDFPVHVRVWRSKDSLNEVIPTHVLDSYAGMPITFMDDALPNVRVAGQRNFSLMMRDDMAALVASGAPYQCFVSAMSPDNLVPNLEVFQGVFGVSSANGVFRFEPRREAVITQVAAYDPRALYLARALRCIARGQRPPSPPDGVLQPDDDWIKLRLKTPASRRQEGRRDEMPAR